MPASLGEAGSALGHITARELGTARVDPHAILSLLPLPTLLLHPHPHPHPQVIAPMVDLEVRGVPALSYFGNVVWKDVYDQMNTGGSVRRVSGIVSCYVAHTRTAAERIADTAGQH